MESPDVQVGMLVRVNEEDRNPDLRGQVGMVTQRYGKANYAAFDVLLDTGRSELFWSYEIEEACAPLA
jgi:hypothetical protein